MSLSELDIKSLCLRRSAKAGSNASSLPIRESGEAEATPSRGPTQLDPPPAAPTREADRQAVGADLDPKHARIMVVDDEILNVKVTQKHLRDAGYQTFVTTTDSREAIRLMRRECPDVVLLDIMMPHVSGLDVLRMTREDGGLRHLPILMLTAATDEETKLSALELGATDILNKPVVVAELLLRVRNALIVKAHHDNLVEYSDLLENDVRLRTQELEESREEVIRILACAAECRDKDTGNHVLRVGRYAGIVARKLGIEEEQTRLIEQAALLHDVGKIGIPDAILLKPARLDEHEMETMREHCEYGFNILKGMPAQGTPNATAPASHWRVSQSPVLNLAALIAMTHHEKWDGSGYPRGLRGESIPIEGRIMAVVDVFDALHSRRPYKDSLTADKCLEILKEGRGSHFDPVVLDAFLARFDEVMRVAVEQADG